MKTVRLLLFLLAGTAVLSAAPRDEIEGLLCYLRKADGAVFIRNGHEHTPLEAETHLRLKWEKQGNRISSAEQFIALCGSRSSITGERYRIRFKDGQLRYTDEVLTEQLQRLRQRSR
ncbi:DUF5329 family protein [Opitutus terrae]|uniref:Lipoprotein n=1 Tax=Opitutus terrae (strain DSM 11246 / JCM 15787 / PB90-1) TaxID=452637 RepID=B1ZX15_OPITP|nr:DUF5329 family protein [Opitutus terrae]ACB75126.1 hypothetical protein Oter_1843 [Opitutus terrae PB90-1]